MAPNAGTAIGTQRANSKPHRIKLMPFSLPGQPREVCTGTLIHALLIRYTGFTRPKAAGCAAHSPSRVKACPIGRFCTERERAYFECSSHRSKARGHGIRMLRRPSPLGFKRKAPRLRGASRPPNKQERQPTPLSEAWFRSAAPATPLPHYAMAAAPSRGWSRVHLLPLLALLVRASRRGLLRAWDRLWG